MILSGGGINGDHIAIRTTFSPGLNEEIVFNGEEREGPFGPLEGTLARSIRAFGFRDGDSPVFRESARGTDSA